MADLIMSSPGRFVAATATTCASRGTESAAENYVRDGRADPNVRRGARMKAVFTFLAALWLANVFLASANTEAAAETMRFTITQNDDPIGTHTVEINRTDTETTVNITTELAVNVLFFTAYHLEQKESERWVDGHLVALQSATDNNGARHKVTVAMRGSELTLDADGKKSRLDKDIVPASFWNPEFLRHAVVLDPQDGRP
jgi:hypothetical protein